MDRKHIFVIVIITALLTTSISAVLLSMNISEQPEDLDPSKNSITIVDLANRTVTLDVPVETVVLMDSSMLSVLAAVVGEDFMEPIVGLSSIDLDSPDFFRGAYLSEYSGFADITDMGKIDDQSFSIETVLSMNPDVVILPLWGKAYNMEPDLSSLDEIGIPYVYTDFMVDPYSGASPSVSLIGALFDQNERANELNTFYTQQLNTVYDVLDTLDESYLMPTIYNEMPWEGPSTYGTTYVATGMAFAIEYARGTNIAEGATDAWRAISPEFLIDKNPDVIVIWMSSQLGSSLGGNLTGYGVYPSTEEMQSLVSAFSARDGWDSLDAVQNGRLHFCFPGFGFSIENFVSLQYMAKWLYPDMFTSLDPYQNLKDFHTEFMPIPADGTWAFCSSDFRG
jgi:iron complex transport system substrate-binding protein